MQIGLYFGSFNPIHIGHLIIANHVLQHSEIDKLWFVLTPHNPLKDAHTLLNEYDRMHLVELAIRDNPKFRASGVEFRLPKPTYTIDTLTYLNEKFPLEKFHVVMGSDSLQNISRWKNYEQLLAQYPIIVYRRRGFEMTPPSGARINMLEAPLLDISASFIRNEIKAGRSVRYLLPDAVWQYVDENRYFH
ncbi:MAG: nicotinate-nucleotide adenylyltransferase [Bacteroidetes bacterium]|nr:nicotinate-nucleotide adenylyltransferase [Bacteroidota bacterium]MBS1629632.1 nicotinate-nucleotide adenylyltransferase [Bacteroidota bacterium]